MHVIRSVNSFFAYLRNWWHAPAKDTVYSKTTAGDTFESSVRGMVLSFLFVVLTWLAENALNLPIDENKRNWVAAIAGALVTLIQLRRRYYHDSTGMKLPCGTPPPCIQDGPDNTNGPDQ